MIFLDTSYVISYFMEDKHHEKAFKLWQKIKKKDLIISKSVMGEVLTVLKGRKYKVSNDKVKEIHEKIMDNCLLIDDYMYHEEAVVECLENDLSYFDTIYYILMINKGLTNVASYDKGFDQYPEIRRIG
ncbi:MAG: type II toxin-antitoxin system VapC family toxin [Methanobrevibacter sp.]|jgi:predicted nucleic acid-binding protein|nr:type II toxin-antitoxin system VapC family toxin [Candidatus Methanovirga aequatorialis]